MRPTLQTNHTLPIEFGSPPPISQITGSAEQLRFEQGETERLLGTQTTAAASKLNPDLALSEWLVFLRQLPDGKVGLLANLPQDVTHLEVTVTSGSGAGRTFTVPKDADLQAALGLGRLADGTKITVTPLRSEGTDAPERGPTLALTWSLRTKPPANVKAHLEELDSVLRGADKLGPAGIAAKLHELTNDFLAWAPSDHLYLWSDAATGVRRQLVSVYEQLAAKHPDLLVPGSLTEHEKTLPREEQEEIVRSRTKTLKELLEKSGEGEAMWRKQAEDLAAKLGS